MATRDANKAVELYRDVERKRWEFDRVNERLSAMVGALTKEEFADYMRMTSEINVEIDRVEQRRAVSHWGLATWRTNFRMALNGAGKDYSYD